MLPAARGEVLGQPGLQQYVLPPWMGPHSPVPYKPQRSLVATRHTQCCATHRAKRRMLPPVPPLCSSVDKLMSQDIQRFMATGVDKTNLSPRPPRVAPSIAPMSQPTQAVMEGYPRSSLVLPVGSERVPRGDSKKAMRGEDKYFELYLRDSLALDPNAYTGSAELRGEVTPASPQQHVSTWKGSNGSCEMHIHQTTVYAHFLLSLSVELSLVCRRCEMN